MKARWFFRVAFPSYSVFISPPLYNLAPQGVSYSCSITRGQTPKYMCFLPAPLWASRESVNIFQDNSPAPAEIPKGPRRKGPRRGERAGNSTSRSFPRSPPSPPPSSCSWFLVCSADCGPAKAPVGGMLHLKSFNPSKLRSFSWSA